MNARHHPDDDLQADLRALGKQFEAEDREDARKVSQERREDRERAAAGKPPMKRRRDITTFEGFASGGVVPRGWGER